MVEVTGIEGNKPVLHEASKDQDNAKPLISPMASSKATQQNQNMHGSFDAKQATDQLLPSVANTNSLSKDKGESSQPLIGSTQPQKSVYTSNTSPLSTQLHVMNPDADGQKSSDATTNSKSKPETSAGSQQPQKASQADSAPQV